MKTILSGCALAVGSLNTRGDTSFAGAGVAWTIGEGPVYVRPGIGLVGVRVNWGL